MAKYECVEKRQFKGRLWRKGEILAVAEGVEIDLPEEFQLIREYTEKPAKMVLSSSEKDPAPKKTAQPKKAAPKKTASKK